MKTIVTTKLKFKKDQETIENLLVTYGFRQITSNMYIGKLSKKDRNEFEKELYNNHQEHDTIIVMPICERCYKNIQQYGNEINLDEEKYVIL